MEIGNKILFLDIDGVVNCEKTFFIPRHEVNDPLFRIDPFMALLVGRIIEATNAKIVLSSSWRHHPDGKAIVRKRVWDFIDQTPNDANGFRGNEIEAWLKNHPEVTHYAILDDDSDMLPEQLVNFFHTSWKTGLTEEIANAVIKHLNQ